MDGISKKKILSWLIEFNESSEISVDRHIDFFIKGLPQNQWIHQTQQLTAEIQELIAEKGYDFKACYAIALNQSLRKSPPPARLTGNSIRTAPCPPIIFLYRGSSNDSVAAEDLAPYQPQLSALYGKDVYYYQSDHTDGRWRYLYFI